MSFTYYPYYPIFDDNIKELVELYINDKRNLPSELAGIPIGDWSVSGVTDMDYLFFEATNFNEDINGWDVSSVTTMEGMFFNCEKFNKPLDRWHPDNVLNMSHMFFGCREFNQYIGRWDFTNWQGFENEDINMDHMFSGCTNFNQPLQRWNVSNVTNMQSMFCECTSFNQPLQIWNVSKVTNMQNMFCECTSFNQPLQMWNVSNVTNMRNMFTHCLQFNQKMDGPVHWDVQNVTDFSKMFKNCPGVVFDEETDLANRWNFREAEERIEMFDEDKWPPYILSVHDMLAERAAIDPNEIHKAMGKVDFEKFIKHLKKCLSTLLIKRIIDLKRNKTTFNYANYINNSFLNIIHDTQSRNELSRVMELRLIHLDYGLFSDTLLDALYFTLEYVKLQPSAFQKSYIETFLYDCRNAHNAAHNANEEKNKMSCPLGVLERIIVSLKTPCTESISLFQQENNDDMNVMASLSDASHKWDVEKQNEYELILALLTKSYPKVLINEYVRDWYILHTKNNEPDEEIQLLSDEERRNNLRNFIVGKFNSEDFTVDLENVINEFLHPDATDVSNESFAYVGGRGKKRRRTQKRQATKKRKARRTGRKRIRSRKISKR